MFRQIMFIQLYVVTVVTNNSVATDLFAITGFIMVGNFGMKYLFVITEFVITVFFIFEFLCTFQLIATIHM